MKTLAKPEAHQVLERLSRVEFLRALPPEEVQSLTALVEPVSYQPGEHLMEQGAGGDALYFIDEGSAQVRRADTQKTWSLGPGDVAGEIALFTGEARSATVVAETALTAWRMPKHSFDELIARSPGLRMAVAQVVEQRLKGIALALPSRRVWVSTALRAIEARYRGFTGWQLCMGLGLVLWLALALGMEEHLEAQSSGRALVAGLQLLSGLLVLQGACEAFLMGVEQLGARLRWDGFISGTIGSLLSTLPEFVVIAFLVRVNPLAGFVTAIVTVFNNALAFSIYSFFLPKDRDGSFAMPKSLTKAGGEILIAGGCVSLIVGLVMVVVRMEGRQAALSPLDLLGISLVLLAIYGYYTLTLVRYYGEGQDNRESVPPNPERLGHNTSWKSIGGMFTLGALGAYCGGEAVGGFAESALNRLGLPTVPTAAFLAFFAGISEYIIVFKSHRRGELGIALSNVFGGITQVLFLLLPFGMLVIGILGLATGDPRYTIPINAATSMLMLLLFPLFYALHQYVEQEKSLSNLDAAAMTGIYFLLLYFLFTSTA